MNAMARQRAEPTVAEWRAMLAEYQADYRLCVYIDAWPRVVACQKKYAALIEEVSRRIAQLEGRREPDHAD